MLNLFLFLLVINFLFLGKISSSASVSRESSAKKAVTNSTGKLGTYFITDKLILIIIINVLDDKQIDKSNDKAKRKTKKQKSG